MGQSNQPDSTTPLTPNGEVAVEITVVGQPADLQRIRSVIEPRPLGGQRPRWARVERFDPTEILTTIKDYDIAIVRCWVDVSDPTRARLYLVARSGQRFLVRDVELSGNFNEVDRESLSNVLELSITALLDDEKVGLTRAQAAAVLADRGQQPSKTPVAQPPLREEVAPKSVETIVEHKSPERRARFQVQGGGFYGAVAPGGGLPVAHGPGLWFGLGGARDGPALAAWLSGQYRWAERIEGADVGAELSTIAVRGGTELRIPLAAYRLSARLGVGADVVRLSPRPGTIDRSAMLTPDRWSQALAFTAILAIERVIGSRFLLGAAVLAEVLPTAVHYDQDVAGSKSQVASPNRIRPGLMVELAFR